MAYRKAYIDGCAGFGWAGGPEFKTRIRQFANGRERRNADWAVPRHKYTLPFLNISADQYRAVRQMFENSRGMLHAFLYLDPLDFQADDELVAVAGSGDDTFQLVKTSVIDGVSYQRPIYALYAPGTDGSAIEQVPVVTVDGASTTVFTADHERGVIVFDSPLSGGEIIRWSGQFSVWVRFDQDWLPFSIDNRRGADDYARNGEVSLIELPPPPEPVSS